MPGLKAASVCLFVLYASGCDLTTGPAPQPPLDLAIDFCSDRTPVFFAFQNFGDDWTRVTPDAQGTFRFTAEFRVAVLYVVQNGADYHTEIIGALNTELEQISGTQCLEEAGAKQLNGTVSGLGPETGLVSLAFASAFVQEPQTSFTLTALPDRAIDLVASRVDVSDVAQASNRIIIRKNLSLVSGTSMPVLDFESAEAFEPVTNTVRVRGTDGGETGLYNNFFTAQGTSHLLFYAALTNDDDLSVPAIPTSQSASGDYHDMFVVETSVGSNTASFRGVETFFRTPRDKLLPLGSDVGATPVITIQDTIPYLRPRVRLAVASNEYESAFNVVLTQQFQQFSVTRVSVTVTLPFFNAIGAWDVAIPDLSGVDGWQNAWGLQRGTPFGWSVTIYGTRTALLFGATPQEDEAVFVAGMTSLNPPPVLPIVTSPAVMRRRGIAMPRPDEVRAAGY